MSSSGGRAPDSPSNSLPSEPESRAQPSPASSEASGTSASTPSNVSRTHSASLSPTSSFRRAQRALTTQNSLVVPVPPTTTSAMPGNFSKRSTKRTKVEGVDPHRSSATPAPADRRWHVRPHREVEKRIAQFASDVHIFRPSIGELIDALETNPKQFPKKHGPLHDARAAEPKFADGVTWRAVFRLDEETRSVFWLSLDPHDAAYKSASNRV